MLVTISSSALTVKVEDLGAQLASIRSPDGTEYLWQGDPNIWARRAPILFPVLGRLRDSRYLLDGVPYTIPTHGFARDSVFSVVEQAPDSVSFQLIDSPETLACYPFAFSLTVTYTLSGNRLTKTHRVENRSDREMLYELGAHDGFRAPLGSGEQMGEYAIRLPGLEAIRPYGMDEQCMVTPKGREIPLSNGRMPLTPASYGLDTVILDRPPRACAVLVDSADRPRVTVEFDQFPYLGIWTQNKPFDTNYVCIEPWSTLPDAVFVGRELGDKASIRRLAPGAAETLSYSVTFS